MKEIERLEKEARKLEPDPENREQFNALMIGYADRFLHTLSGGKAYFSDASPSQELLDLEFSDEGRPMEELLQILHRAVDQTGINPASGKHLGYIPGGGVFPTAIGDYLAAATNRYAGMFFASPGAVRMENKLLRWLCRLVGYPDDALGNLSSGGSIANLIAITTARDKLGIRSAEVPDSVVYLTRQTHHCVQKALRIAGMGETIIRYIPMDDRFRMQAHSLDEQISRDLAAGLRPFLLVGSAGTTDTGAIDPLDEMARVAKRYDMWFHVDAAYGGAFLLVDGIKAAFKGIERSDSVTIDPHTGFFLSYGIGAVLIRDPKAMYASHHYSAQYLQDAEGNNQDWSPADLSPELTKHFRGLRMWLPLQLLGLRPFRAALEEKLWLTRYFYEEIQQYGFEVCPYPQLSVLLFRYRPSSGQANAFNQQMIQWIQQDGRFFFSSTTVNGQFFFRLAVLSFRTHKKEIDAAMGVLRQAVAAVHAEKEKQKLIS
jgi:glutamate/tyrosine decarboxylase-like PLP-dependent enzyme